MRDLLIHITEGLIAISGDDKALNKEFGLLLFKRGIAAEVITEQTLLAHGISPNRAKAAIKDQRIP